MYSCFDKCMPVQRARHTSHYIAANRGNLLSTVNLAGGLGGLFHWTFWLIHWEFVDYFWARAIVPAHRVSARKFGSLRVVLFMKIAFVTVIQKNKPCGALDRTGPQARSTGFSGWSTGCFWKDLRCSYPQARVWKKHRPRRGFAVSTILTKWTS